MAYLVHLAQQGAAYIHPLGASATTQLLVMLEVRPGNRILEIGCGTGSTLALAAQAHAAQFTGIDLLPAMLQAARPRVRSLRNVCLAQANGVHLPLASDVYDRVYTESVLGFQTALDTRAMLAEIFRVLKPRGRYLANEAIWKTTVDASVAARINALSLRDFGLRPASELPWHVDEWLTLMLATGFCVRSADLLIPTKGFTRSSSWLKWLKIFLRPHLLAPALYYRRRLRAHQDEGKYLEARLFVLEKPV